MERRIAHLLIPGRSPGSVMVDAHGGLPAFPFTVDAGETTVSAFGQGVLPGIGLGGPIIDCLIDQTRSPDPDAAVAVLVELAEPAVDWVAPDGWHPIAATLASLEIEPGLMPRLRAWLDERSGGGEIDPLRPAWARLGWFARAERWIEDSLDALGLPPPTSVLQFRHWGISALIRVETPSGRFWFKAVFDHFRSEAGITAFLDRELPGLVPGVLAAEPDEGWLLLEDLGPGSTARDVNDHRQSFAYLARAQRRLVGRKADLLAAGCAQRPLAAVPSELAGALTDPVVRPWIDLPPKRVRQLVDWLEQAVARVDALDMPELLVHGDFHPGNVARLDDRRVLFDWSDAAVAKPFVDVMPWATWMSGDAAAVETLWQSFFDEWSATHPVDEWAALRTTLAGVGGAYHIVSYAGIVRSLDTLRRPEHGDGLVDFFSFLDAAVPT